MSRLPDIFRASTHISGKSVTQEFRPRVCMANLRGAVPTTRSRLRESLLVQYEQTAPCLLGLRLTIDARIWRTPAVHGRVHFDFRGQSRLGEGFLHHGLFGGGLHIVIF